MNDFHYKCKQCNLVAFIKSDCPVCSSELELTLRPSIIELSAIDERDLPEIDGDEYDAMRSVFAENDEEARAEAEYWRKVEEDERDFDPLEDFESISRRPTLVTNEAGEPLYWD